MCSVVGGGVGFVLSNLVAEGRFEVEDAHPFVGVLFWFAVFIRGGGWIAIIILDAALKGGPANVVVEETKVGVFESIFILLLVGR